MRFIFAAPEYLFLWIPAFAFARACHCPHYVTSSYPVEYSSPRARRKTCRLSRNEELLKRHVVSLCVARFQALSRPLTIIKEIILPPSTALPPRLPSPAPFSPIDVLFLTLDERATRSHRRRSRSLSAILQASAHWTPPPSRARSAAAENRHDRTLLRRASPSLVSASSASTDLHRPPTPQRSTSPTTFRFPRSPPRRLLIPSSTRPLSPESQSPLEPYQQGFNVHKSCSHLDETPIAPGPVTDCFDHPPSNAKPRRPFPLRWPLKKKAQPRVVDLWLGGTGNAMAAPGALKALDLSRACTPEQQEAQLYVNVVLSRRNPEPLVPPDPFAALADSRRNSSMKALEGWESWAKMCEVSDGLSAHERFQVLGDAKEKMPRARRWA